MENRDFFEWYKRKITDNAQDPPDDAWQNIADELDTNDVWDRVAAELDHRGGWFGQKSWYYALPALLLLLIPAGLYFYYDNATPDTPVTTSAVYADADSNADADRNNVADNNAIANSTADAEGNADTEGQAVTDDNADHNAAADDKAIADHNAVADSGASEAEGANFKVPDSASKLRSSEIEVGSSEFQVADSKVDSSSVEANESVTKPLIADRAGAEIERTAPLSTEDAVFVEAEIAADEPSSRESGIAHEEKSSRMEEENIALQPRGYTSFALRRMMLPDSMLVVDPLAVTLQPDSFDTAIDLPSVVFTRSLEFGISASAKNTWLLNQTTFMGLEKHTLTTTLPDFGKDVGVIVRYNFSAKFSALAEGFLISDMGQRYNEYRKGKYIERDVDLNYFRTQLLVRYGNNSTLLGRLVNGHGIIAGLYYSKLKSATETINGQTTDIATLYSLSDFGIVMGYEYNQHLFSNFFFSTGVRLNYGLSDIRSHAESKTGTGSFDVNFGLRYRFGF